jgi:glycosyltransferase involved in cell wall biosynthesis/GT2 family glycosyltransferase
MGKKPKAVVAGRHLYGAGGGAVATLTIARGLATLGYDVAVHSQMHVSPANAEELGKDGVSFQLYYQGCARGADLLINIDHFEYAEPLAKLNLAHIFHPHPANQPVPAFAERYRFSANSNYTAEWIAKLWDLAVPTLYIPIANNFFQARKRNVILHVSRIARPTPLADKGHTEIIRTFQTLCDAGLEDWELHIAGAVEDPPYLAQLQAQAQKFPIRFYANPPDHIMKGLYANAAFYWHMTGAGMPTEHGAQEHLGLTTLEAMASGAVPVVYGSGGQPEIVTSGVDGILCQDIYSVGQATLNLIGNLSKWSALSQQAQRSAVPWQDWNAWCTRLAAWVQDAPIPPLSAAQRVTTLWEPSDVCVVIPTLLAGPRLDETVRTLLATEPELGQILIMRDLGAADLAKETWLRLRPQDVVWVAREHLSFAHANNEALELTAKPLLLACNDDMVFFDRGWLKAMLASLVGGVGIVGAKLLYPNGALQHAGGMVSWDRPDIGYHRWYGGLDMPAANQREEVPFVTGALLLGRREVWDWDEEMFGAGIGYEDADVCLRAKAHGFQVIYEPAVQAVHLESQTRRVTPEDAALTALNRTAFRDKWFTRFHELYPWWLAGGQADD